MGELRRRLPPHMLSIYYPADFPGVVRRALDIIQPRAIILIEAELWPNLLWQAEERGIPLFLVNARLSERSFKNYGRFLFLFGPIFTKFRAVGCQQTGDAGRLARSGIPRRSRAHGGEHEIRRRPARRAPRPGRAGFAAPRSASSPTRSCWWPAARMRARRRFWREMLPRLRRRVPELFLILVPRHFERAKEAAQELAARGIPFVYRSDIHGENSFAPGQLQCLLVNSTGELKFFYEQASLVFVGKSLTADGGQNPIEPAALGKAMVFGPNMQNFKAVVAAFLSEQAVLQVQDAAGLEQAIAELLCDDRRRSEMGARALKVVQRNLGATARTVQLITERMD